MNCEASSVGGSWWWERWHGEDQVRIRVRVNGNACRAWWQHDTTVPCWLVVALQCRVRVCERKKPGYKFGEKIKIIRSRCTAPAMPGRFLFLHLCFFDLYFIFFDLCFIFLVFVVVEHGSGTRWDRWYEEPTIHTISLSAHVRSVGWLLYVVVKPGCKDLE